MDKITAYLMRKFRRGPERETQPSGHPSGAPRLGRRGLLASALAAVGGFGLGWLIPRRQPVSVSPVTGLAATSLGLGACAVGAFLDDDLNALLGLDGEEEAALYIIAAGKV